MKQTETFLKWFHTIDVLSRESEKIQIAVWPDRDHQLACGGRRTISGIQECSLLTVEAVNAQGRTQAYLQSGYSQFTIVDGTAVELFNYFITNNK